MFSFMKKMKSLLPAAGTLPGREEKMRVPERHFINGNALQAPFPAGMEQAVFGLGCFWGAEKLFWSIPGVYSTAVGYAGGETKNPSYGEVRSGFTNHTEAGRVGLRPQKSSTGTLAKAVWGRP